MCLAAPGQTGESPGREGGQTGGNSQDQRHLRRAVFTYQGHHPGPGSQRPGCSVAQRTPAFTPASLLVSHATFVSRPDRGEGPLTWGGRRRTPGVLPALSLAALFFQGQKTPSLDLQLGWEQASPRYPPVSVPSTSPCMCSKSAFTYRVCSPGPPAGLELPVLLPLPPEC